MTLLCTVTRVTQDRLYDLPYWTVELRIDEKIFVAKNYQERLAKISRLESGDFRERKVGERLVVFAGGERYEGDDFLLPCWEGTSTDLGILLESKEEDRDKNERLLTHLRKPQMNSGFFEAFAAFCPRGVAGHFITEMSRRELDIPASSAK